MKYIKKRESLYSLFWELNVKSLLILLILTGCVSESRSLEGPSDKEMETIIENEELKPKEEEPKEKVEPKKEEKNQVLVLERTQAHPIVLNWRPEKYGVMEGKTVSNILLDFPNARGSVSLPDWSIPEHPICGLQVEYEIDEMDNVLKGEWKC